jgi:hypothetical protein
VSVSTTFVPRNGLDALPTDLILLSVDSVFFNVHSHRLLAASQNGFGGLLPRPTGRSDPDTGPDGGGGPAVVPVGDESAVLNLVLHATYGLSCAQYAPSFSMLAAAVRACATYGLDLARVCTPGTPLADAIVRHAPIRPMDTYVLAAQHGLHDLAVLASAHLVSFPLSSITDELAEAIGAVYLKKLFFLHLGRADALRRLLVAPPPSHSPNAQCGYDERGKLTRAWALAAAYLAWDSKPGERDTPVFTFAKIIQGSLMPNVAQMCFPVRLKLRCVPSPKGLAASSVERRWKTG